MAAAANSRSGASGGIPWYKEKYPRSKYLVKGDPVSLREDDLRGLQNWREIIPEMEELWVESQNVCKQKNKKREFKVTYGTPEKTDDGFRLSIEILHVDYRGFSYVAFRKDEYTLNRHFWPVVEQLIAIFLSPRIAEPARNLPLLPGEQEDDNHFEVRMNLM